MTPFFFAALPPRFDVALRDVGAKDPKARLNAVRSLAHPPEGQAARAGDALRTLVRDADVPVRCAAIEVLGLLRDTPSAVDIVACFEDPVSEVRETALIAAARIGSDVARAPLERALRSEHPEVRFQAAESVAELAPEDAHDALVPLLSDRDPKVRANTACALAKAGDPRSPAALAVLLGDAHASVRMEAGLALAAFEDPRGVPALREALHDPERAMAAAEGLGRIGARAAVDDLARIAESFLKPAMVKAACGAALVRLGDARGVAALRSALTAWRSDARSYAAEQCGELGITELAAQLVALVDRPRGADPVVVVRALAALGDESAEARAAIDRLGRRRDALGAAARGEPSADDDPRERDESP